MHAIAERLIAIGGILAGFAQTARAQNEPSYSVSNFECRDENLGWPVDIEYDVPDQQYTGLTAPHVAERMWTMKFRPDFRGFSPAVKLFMFAHECGHVNSQDLGVNAENAANCWAAKRLTVEHAMSDSDWNQVAEMLMQYYPSAIASATNPGSGYKSGAEQVRDIVTCISSVGNAPAVALDGMRADRTPIDPTMPPNVYGGQNSGVPSPMEALVFLAPEDRQVPYAVQKTTAEQIDDLIAADFGPAPREWTFILRYGFGAGSFEPMGQTASTIGGTTVAGSLTRSYWFDKAARFGIEIGASAGGTLYFTRDDSTDIVLSPFARLWLANFGVFAFGNQIWLNNADPNGWSDRSFGGVGGTLALWPASKNGTIDLTVRFGVLGASSSDYAVDVSFVKGVLGLFCSVVGFPDRGNEATSGWSAMGGMEFRLADDL